MAVQVVDLVGDQAGQALLKGGDVPGAADVGVLDVQDEQAGNQAAYVR